MRISEVTLIILLFSLLSPYHFVTSFTTIFGVVSESPVLIKELAELLLFTRFMDLLGENVLANRVPRTYNLLKVFHNLHTLLPLHLLHIHLIFVFQLPH